MRQYLNIVQKVLDQGQVRQDRTGVGTRSLFGVHFEHDLDDGFPLLTTKKMRFDSIVKELLWFLRGESNTKTLGCGIWDAWADKDGECGPIYGPQWRGTGGSHNVDQIASLIEGLRHQPYSRRHIVSAWDVDKIDSMALPPCHAFFQCYVRGGKLDLQLYQRSADLGLGVPFNIASYALLNHLLCAATGLLPGRLLVTYGDAHIYTNHEAALREQLEREPRPLPLLLLDNHVIQRDCLDLGDTPGTSPVTRLKPHQFDVFDYKPWPEIRLPVAV